MTNGVKEVLLVIQEVGPLDSDNYCYERSEYTMYGADKKVVDQGKYVICLVLMLLLLFLVLHYIIM